MRGDAAVCLAREQHTKELIQICLETVSPWGHESPGALYVVSQNMTLGTRCHTWEHGPAAYAGRYGFPVPLSCRQEHVGTASQVLRKPSWQALSEARDRAGSTGQRVPSKMVFGTVTQDCTESQGCHAVSRACCPYGPGSLSQKALTREKKAPA